MRDTPKQKSRSSVLLLGLVVVVIGLIVIVAASRRAYAAKVANGALLRERLGFLRLSIEMYAREHDGVLPGADGQALTFRMQLMQPTSASGNFKVPGDPKLGPYLRHMPTVPVGRNQGNSAVLMTTADPIRVQGGKAGWVYNYQTGEIIANTNDLDEHGVAYATY